MPFINAALGDAQEASAVPEGNYHLRIMKKEDTKTAGKGGKPVRDMTKVYIRIEDPNYPNASMITQYLVYPLSTDEPDTKNLMNLNVRRFLAVFEIPWEAAGFNTDDLPGAEADCLLSQEMVTPEDGGPDYPVNRLVLPRLAQE